MTVLRWYLLLTACNAVLVLIAVMVVRRFGYYVGQGKAQLDRAEAIVQSGHDVAIQFRACVGWLHDLEHEKKRDHPVVPPDSIPDDVERSVA